MANVGMFVREIMLQMQKRNFTQGEAELVPKFLEREIERNSKQLEYYKPFTVYGRTNHDNNAQ